VVLKIWKCEAYFIQLGRYSYLGDLFHPAKSYFDELWQTETLRFTSSLGRIYSFPRLADCFSPLWRHSTDSLPCTNGMSFHSPSDTSRYSTQSMSLSWQWNSTADNDERKAYDTTLLALHIQVQMRNRRHRHSRLPNFQF